MILLTVQLQCSLTVNEQSHLRRNSLIAAALWCIFFLRKMEGKGLVLSSEVADSLYDESCYRCGLFLCPYLKMHQ